ncbi:oxidoreductase HTATIP2-like [Gigantopelta aegis]|uniref:oxidoreductase HTATIP2-like n=1 Tax=Gigantopelta aegis TaxID=1735272 RepID=UPI001B889573|nr:oxidoreductase HTATIP2-like [Gigantopelta aegis]
MQFLWIKCEDVLPGVGLGVLTVALFLGAFFFYHEVQDSPEVERNCRMAAEATNNSEEFKMKGHSAFIVGYTGAVGKVLTKELAKAKLFKKVLLIGRREIDLDDDIGNEFEQKVVDFEKFDDYADIFKDVKYGFCCLGTTRAKSGAQGFIRVDHDYVMKSAELAKTGGCKHYNFVSTQAADKNSSFLYTKTKGQVEEELKAIQFERLSLLRPGVLLGEREESRPGEAVAKFFLKPVAYLFPTAITTPMDVVAKAMINNMLAPVDRPVELYENKAIHQLSGVSKGCSGSKSQDGGDKK